MNTFINVLGENYQKRHLLNGLTRYKWSNGLMIVKAGFDESGNLVCNKIMPRIIFRFKSELLFSSRV
ncbi:MAG TPA: hypothetical protein VFC65_00480 [Prolixibacteraceae bacterium]|nr:hypothetical protein [Prolixibacteraceae bacterium]